MAAEKQTTEVRQDEIARAALELVGTVGMKGLSMAAIARKVGIVPSGIYRHFSSKDDVIDAILDYLQRGLSGNVRAIALLEVTALERLHSLLMKHIDLVRQNKSIPVVVFSTEVYNGSPHRRVKLRGIIEAYLAEIAAMVGQGQLEGSIREALDPKAVAVMFMGLVQPSTILWHLSAGEYDAMKQAETAWPIFCSAIERRTPSERKVIME
ncbi:MAG: TetR/AcrR family transcriptional regulator [Kiritimatiellae bacterium]|nr:TetR/AcrR family transcriptional regulator [Kiritimatiellia bacterium]